MPDEHHEVPKFRNPVDYINTKVYNFFDRPVTWFRESIVKPNQKDYNWYHRSFRRVPTVDECYIDDKLCIYEANMQYLRDRAVDTEILNLLRKRLDDCFREEYPDHQKCMPLKLSLDDATENWFIKYGDLGAQTNVVRAYNKQKHRLIWERRHGKVGTGKNTNQMSAESE